MHITHRAKNKQAGLAPLEKIGFTLVEVTIVAGIIITGMVAVQTAVQYGLRAATSNVDGMVAAHLAEEGLELVRNIRDTNWAKDALWDTYMPSTSDGDYQLYYELKTTLPNVPLCSIVTSCSSQPLYFDSALGLYGYNGWGGTFNSGSPSPFTRLVKKIRR